MPKRKLSPAVVDVLAESIAGIDGIDDDGGGAMDSSPYKQIQRPSGVSAKEEQKLQKQKDLAIRPQARAMANMVAASAKKAQVLKDQAAFALLTMPDHARMPQQGKDYLALRRQEETTKLKRRIVLERATETREAAKSVGEVAREDNNNEDRGILKNHVLHQHQACSAPAASATTMATTTFAPGDGALVTLDNAEAV